LVKLYRHQGTQTMWITQEFSKEDEKLFEDISDNVLKKYASRGTSSEIFEAAAIPTTTPVPKAIFLRSDGGRRVGDSGVRAISPFPDICFPALATFLY